MGAQRNNPVKRRIKVIKPKNIFTFRPASKSTSSQENETVNISLNQTEATSEIVAENDVFTPNFNQDTLTSIKNTPTLEKKMSKK